MQSWDDTIYKHSAHKQGASMKRLLSWETPCIVILPCWVWLWIFENFKSPIMRWVQVLTFRKWWVWGGPGFWKSRTWWAYSQHDTRLIPGRKINTRPTLILTLKPQPHLLKLRVNTAQWECDLYTSWVLCVSVLLWKEGFQFRMSQELGICWIQSPANNYMFWEFSKRIEDKRKFQSKNGRKQTHQ